MHLATLLACKPAVLQCGMRPGQVLRWWPGAQAAMAGSSGGLFLAVCTRPPL